MNAGSGYPLVLGAIVELGGRAAVAWTVPDGNFTPHAAVVAEGDAMSGFGRRAASTATESFRTRFSPPTRAATRSSSAFDEAEENASFDESSVVVRDMRTGQGLPVLSTYFGDAGPALGDLARLRTARSP
ncbi:hypothetical protein BH20ACT16_BH20ACT16_16620 [soil metagenome]